MTSIKNGYLFVKKNVLLLKFFMMHEMTCSWGEFERFAQYHLNNVWSAPSIAQYLFFSYILTTQGSWCFAGWLLVRDCIAAPFEAKKTSKNHV